MSGSVADFREFGHDCRPVWLQVGEDSESVREEGFLPTLEAVVDPRHQTEAWLASENVMATLCRGVAAQDKSQKRIDSRVKFASKFIS